MEHEKLIEKHLGINTPYWIKEKVNNAINEALRQPHDSGSLLIHELFEKLQSMRLDKNSMEAMGQLQSYGYTDCINDLLEWVHSKRQ